LSAFEIFVRATTWQWQAAPLQLALTSLVAVVGFPESVVFTNRLDLFQVILYAWTEE